MAGRNPETDKLVAPRNFKGPTESRHCTDILCFLMLVATWIVMTAVGLFVTQRGDYRHVLYPLDYEGNICGTDFNGIDMTNYSKLYYVNQFTGVCVDHCPNLRNLTDDNKTDVRTLVTYDGIFQAFGGGEVSDDFLLVAPYPNNITDDEEYDGSNTCTLDKCLPGNDVIDSWTSDGIREGYGYAYYLGSTHDILQRCYMTDGAEDRIANLTGADIDGLVGRINTAEDFFTSLFGDVWNAKKYVLGIGFGLSFFMSLVYIFLMRLPLLLNGIVWSSIFITIGMFFVAGYFSYQYVGKLEDDPTIEQHKINMTKAASAISFIIGILLVLLTICLRKAIQTSISCVREAGKAINSMPLLLIVPVLQAVGFIAVLGVTLVYGIYLASMGEIETKEIDTSSIEYNEILLRQYSDTTITYRTYTFNDNIKYMGWFLLFCFFWTSNFITAYGDMAVAMAVAKWYFTRDKVNVGSLTVISSLVQTGFYHAGTCAFGSLVLAIIQIIRTILAKFQKWAKETKNQILIYLLCICQCCFWCLEKCIKFLNKNAYIQTAIFSTSFCTSAKEAFYLVIRNAARFTAVTWISAAVLIVGKLFISTVTTVIGYILITEYLDSELSTISGPVVVIFLISYWISDFFMDVFDMGISTVLHCLIADEEMFDNERQYAEKSLKRYVDQVNGDNDSSSSTGRTTRGSRSTSSGGGARVY